VQNIFYYLLDDEICAPLSFFLSFRKNGMVQSGLKGNIPEAYWTQTCASLPNIFLAESFSPHAKKCLSAVPKLKTGGGARHSITLRYEPSPKKEDTK
jgi:hypothetical protein